MSEGVSDETDQLLQRAKRLMQEGRNEAALAQLGQLLELEPERLEALGQKGEALRRLGRHREAIAALDAAIAEIRGERQTQVGEWGELSDVPPPAMRNIFDALYQAFDDGGSPDAALLRAIRRVHAELLPRFQNAARAQTDDQRRWRQEILQLSRALP